jgi:SAM-dependent methyltransferase
MAATVQDLRAEFNALSPDPRLTALLDGYPADIFSPRLYQSITWADRYVTALGARIIVELGMLPALSTPGTAATLVARLHLSPPFTRALAWLLERLAGAGLIAAAGHDGSGMPLFRASLPWPDIDTRALREVGLAIDPANQATIDLIDAAAHAYPSLARGELASEEALSGIADAALWTAYFANDNPLYAVNNRIAAIAAADRLAHRPGLRILEVGSGTGSATLALLGELERQDRLDHLGAYLATEISPLFRRRSQRMLRTAFAQAPLTLAPLDINSPWQEQLSDHRAAAGGFDLVYAVNVFHVARDLRFSLSQARSVLNPGGLVVAGECIRPFADAPVSIEFVFQVMSSYANVPTDPMIRPRPGFLTPEQWLAACAAAGFREAAITPDHLRTRDIFPLLLAGAICGR